VNFGSHLDAIVRTAAALVNVGTAGERQGRPYEVPGGDELITAVHEALQQSDRRVDPPPRADLGDFLELAAAVRPVFDLMEAGALDDAARTVNGLLARYRPTPFLESHGGTPWHLHFHGPLADDRSGWGGPMATGLASVLGSGYADRLGVCGAPACDRVFVDVSRNGNRRFCSETCQNRVKAAAHRARQRAAAS
jgi:predicted RNA-binding Zn ribbon-like protein